MGRTARRLALVAVVVSAVLFGGGSPASAHVSIHAEDAVPGELARVVFRVPNESDALATTQLEIHFPEASPIPTATTLPVPGWSVEVDRRTLDAPVEGAHGEPIEEAVATITWTAQDDESALQPGEFGEFSVLIGPLPEVAELFFPALQWYEGVDEPVRWIELPEPDGSEPPSPAPVLRLAAPASPDSQSGEPDSDGATGDGATGDRAAGNGATGNGATGEQAGNAGVWLGLAGLIAGLAGLALGGLAFARTRR